jgi:hypothetical protein
MKTISPSLLLSELPQEILSLIWRYSGVENLLQFRLVSKEWSVYCLNPQLWCTLLEETHRVGSGPNRPETSEANGYTCCYKSYGISSDLHHTSMADKKHIFASLEINLKAHRQGIIEDSFDFHYEAATYLSLWTTLQSYQEITPDNTTSLNIIHTDQTTDPRVRALVAKILNLARWLPNPEQVYDLLTRSLLGFFRFIVSAKKWEGKCQRLRSNTSVCCRPTLPLSLSCTSCLIRPRVWDRVRVIELRSGFDEEGFLFDEVY